MIASQKHIARSFHHIVENTNIIGHGADPAVNDKPASLCDMIVVKVDGVRSAGVIVKAKRLDSHRLQPAMAHLNVTAVKDLDRGA